MGLGTFLSGRDRQGRVKGQRRPQAIGKDQGGPSLETRQQGQAKNMAALPCAVHTCVHTRPPACCAWHPPAELSGHARVGCAAPPHAAAQRSSISQQGTWPQARYNAKGLLPMRVGCLGLVAWAGAFLGLVGLRHNCFQG